MSTHPILNPNLFNPHLYRSILTLWFHSVPHPASTVPHPILSRWYGFSPPDEAKAFDAQCSSTAKEALQSLAPSRFPLPPSTTTPSDPSTRSKIAEPFLAQLTPSTKSKEEAPDLAPEQIGLALILLLDQFPRNIFRADQSLIYTHYDRIAQSILHALLDRNLDAHPRYQDSPPWRLWFYMPLTHSESLSDHDIFSAKLAEMTEGARARGDEEAVGFIDNARTFEDRHRVILERFGRYPHRNGSCGRVSSEEEIKYLEEGGETFGSGRG